MADNVIVRVPEQQFIRGEDGYSPEVTIENINHGHSVTITDRDHPTGQSFNVMDGDSAYEQAVAGGYEGTEAQFNEELASFKELSEQAADSAAAAAQSESNAAGSATTATTKAQEAEAAAAQALIRMNSADTSAQAAEDASSFFTSTILPNAVTTINNTRDQAVANVNVAKSTAVQKVQAEGATQISAVQTESTTQQAAIQQKGEDVLASIPSDYTTLSDDVDDLKSAVDQKAPAIYDTAFGAVASFEDGADGMPLKSLTVNIEPVQSGNGDPSPTNIRPISGWTGCNIYHSGEDMSNPTTYPITFPSEAGTVYGGTLDVVNKKLTVDRLFIEFDSSLNIALIQHGSTSVGEAYPYYATIRYVLPSGVSTVADYTKWRFSHGLAQRTSYSGVWRFYTYSANTVQMVIGTDTEITTLSELKSYFDTQKQAGTPVQGVYCITPKQEYTITSPEIITLLGKNNIWASAGDATAEYPADTFMAISSNINLAIDSAHNFIDYGYNRSYYDQKDNSATNSLVLGIERVNQVVTLNKDKQSSGAIRVRLNGSVAKTVLSSTVANWLDDLVYFKGGARYKVTTKHLSGEISSGGIATSIYKAGTSTSIGYSRGELYLNGYAERFFVAEGNVGYNICLVMDEATILANCKVIITIEEIESTEQQYSSEMDTTINSVVGLMTEPCLVFPMLTDIHYMSPRNNINPSQFVRTADNINYFMGKVACDGLICLGDITDGGYSSLPNSVESGIPMISDIFSELTESGKPLYFAVGNHDDFRYVSKYMQPHEIYNYYMRNSATDVIYDEQSYGTNYYKDFPGMKTRLICFNTNILPTSESKGEYGISGRTLTWVTNVLTDMPNDYIGMMITHVSINNGITSAEYPYNVSNGANLRAAIRNSGKLCFVMCGHSHFDIAYKGENDPLIILQGCAKCEGETTVEVTTVDNISGGIRYGRSVDDETADLWDVVVLRPFSKKLDLVRFGAGVDRSFDLTL